MKDDNLKIEWLALKDVKPADYNPRNISNDGLEGLEFSIKKFGLKSSPLVINKRSNVLVSGHQRLKAANNLKLDKVPVIFVDLNNTDERALNVSLNNPKIQGFFTDDLQAMLDELKEDMGDEFEELKLDQLIQDNSWNSDIDAINKVEENLDGITAIIKVSCPQDLKNEVLIYLKAKLMETSFEGVHVE